MGSDPRNKHGVRESAIEKAKTGQVGSDPIVVSELDITAIDGN